MRSRSVVAGLLSFFASLTLWLSSASAQEAARPALRAVQVSTPPAIDGVLDDSAWSGPAQPTGPWLSYNPLHGSSIPQQTRVWVGYDSRYLYFAFQCDDPDPSRIKTSITRRDNIWNDDWVGISLDALGTGQSSYHLLVNPSGIQLDMINTASGNEDESPDYIWDSAGRLNDRGYAVEIRLPLASIRFQGGDNVRMGVLFWRRVSRAGVSVAWPALEPGRWVFEKHASLTFDRLESILTRELIPSATFATNQERATPGRWGSADGRGDLGLSAKVGLTPTITLDATVNPDFSQVESDAFQIEINQRYPVFFSEKRPFFMEGAGLFTLAGSAMDSSMIAAVHTRKIVNPGVGIKLTGSAGRVQFGTLTALDDVPAGIGGSLDAEDRLFNVGRVQFSPGAGNYVGAIVTDMESDEGFNRVAGGDLSWRVSANQRVTGMVLYSNSRAAGAAATDGVAGSASWGYSTRRQNIQAFFEHYDRAFRMDTAFYNRVGITSGWGYTDWNFYPGSGRYAWIRRITPFIFSQLTEDRIAGGSERVTVPGIRMNFTRQGFFRVDKIVGHETWQGERYPLSRPRIQGDVQLFRWIRLSGNVNWGPATFYDEVSPFAGWSRAMSMDVSWQPTPRMSQSIGFRRVDFRRADTRERVYELDLLNTRTTFQFTKQFFLRAIAQYDSLRARVLTDFLASYELRPGTVGYAGYGSLFERRDFAGDQWISGAGEYLTTRRGFFMKASYLYRF
ncbi:MAG TPA: DUF5916 domain-containing protein [Vicinamibacterales bacterium]|nr:DUF5916 domain-containing protein [Vicinamibacterales bacterium]